MEFRVLGPLDVVDGDRSVPLGGHKQRSLLAMLLVHANEIVPTDRLIDAVWGDAPPEGVANTLQVHVSKLRKSLSGGATSSDVLASRSSGYILRVGPNELDMSRFERLVEDAREDRLEGRDERSATRLREALSLWRGPAFADLSYEPFAQAAIQRLEEMRVSALEDRIDSDLALGHHEELVPELEGLVTTYTLRERLRGHLMLALYRSGRQAEALQALEETRRVLREELGVGPGPALQRIQRAILTHDSSLDLIRSTKDEGAAKSTARGDVDREEAEPEPGMAASEVSGTAPMITASDGIADGTTQHDEIRPVTVLFAGIEGSTSLGDRLPPDEVDVLIDECLTRLSRVVEEFGGAIHTCTRDGITAYFGFPATHEDDPGRAAGSALRILRVVEEYGRELEVAWGIEEFNVSVGMNSVHTAAGEGGDTGTQTVTLGDASEVTSRLQAAADPGTIVVGEGAAKRLAHRFTLEPLDDVRTGGADDFSAWELVGTRSIAEPRPSTPLIGRDEELLRIKTSVDELVAGRGSALLLTGEAGMGKTRMLSELRSLAEGDVTWLEGRCGTYGAETSYRPFVEMLRAWIGVERGDAEVAVRTKLGARLGRLLGEQREDVLPLLALTLSARLDPGVEREVFELPADALAGRIRHAYTSWVEALSAQSPIVVAIDDLHWAEPLSRDLAEVLLELTDRAPLLVTTAFRPDRSSEAWRFKVQAETDYPHRTIEIALRPLPPGDATSLVDGLARPNVIDPELRDEIVARAEGNPLYLEELLRGVMEVDGLVRGRTWSLPGGAAASLPPALEGLLVARIERLPPGPRRLAQIAAVAGREFPVRVLERVVETANVDADLAALLRGEIVRELGRFPELVCTFRHGLLQEAALSTLPREALKELYGKVAAAFEELYADSIDDRLESLAFYYYRSRDEAKALEYLERAGERAARQGAVERAGELWNRAGRLAAKLGDETSSIRISEHLVSLSGRTR